jgi:hypothetical protein
VPSRHRRFQLLLGFDAALAQMFEGVLQRSHLTEPGPVLCLGEALGRVGRHLLDAQQLGRVDPQEAALHAGVPAKARHLVVAVPASYVAFDLLAIGGVDLRTQRWTVRRRRLEQLSAGWTTALQLSPVTDNIEEAREWFDVLPEALGAEGLKNAG